LLGGVTADDRAKWPATCWERAGCNNRVHVDLVVVEYRLVGVVGTLVYRAASAASAASAGPFATALTTCCDSQ